MEQENTVKVKKSCAVCEHFMSRVCVLAEGGIEILSQGTLLTNAGYAGLKCESFALHNHLKADEGDNETQLTDYHTDKISPF